MAIKYVPKVGNSTKTLRKLKIGDAFKFDGTTHIKTDEDADDEGVTVRCLQVSGEDIGYLSHFQKDSEVEPVNLTISED